MHQYGYRIVIGLCAFAALTILAPGLSHSHNPSTLVECTPNDLNTGTNVACHHFVLTDMISNFMEVAGVISFTCDSTFATNEGWDVDDVVSLAGASGNTIGCALLLADRPLGQVQERLFDANDDGIADFKITNFSTGDKARIEVYVTTSSDQVVLAGASFTKIGGSSVTLSTHTPLLTYAVCFEHKSRNFSGNTAAARNELTGSASIATNSNVVANRPDVRFDLNTNFNSMSDCSSGTSQGGITDNRAEENLPRGLPGVSEFHKTGAYTASGHVLLTGTFRTTQFGASDLIRGARHFLSSEPSVGGAELACTNRDDEGNISSERSRICICTDRTICDDPAGNLLGVMQYVEGDPAVNMLLNQGIRIGTPKND